MIREMYSRITTRVLIKAYVSLLLLDFQGRALDLEHDIPLGIRTYIHYLGGDADCPVAAYSRPVKLCSGDDYLVILALYIKGEAHVETVACPILVFSSYFYEAVECVFRCLVGDCEL